jgi:YD repeat-containing protein
MRIMSKNCSCLFIWTLITLLLAACGNKSSTVTSTTAPSVFYSHSVAFKSSALYSWGANTYGQLGNADTTGATQLSPLPVSTTLTNVAGVSAGGTHTLAFTSGGAVYAWGNNGFGQLGNGLTVISFLPVQVQLTVPAGSFLLDVTAVAAGGSHSLALQSGTVWAWGDNTYGQLGDATYSNRPTAVQAQDKGTGAPLTQVTKIAAGGGHSLAIAGLDPNSPAYAWGYNGFGQLGQQSSSTTNSSLALPVTQAAGAATLYNVTDIAAGGSHSLFLTSDGTVWACGYNALGQLGDTTTTDGKSGVVQVKGLTGVFSQVAAGLDHSLALKSDGTVWAWGYNFSGQLGNGAALASITPVTAPVQVMINANTPLNGVTKIIAIGNHSLAVTGGQIYAWGENTFGQLGLGDSTNRNYATPVPILNSGADLYHP